MLLLSMLYLYSAGSVVASDRFAIDPNVNLSELETATAADGTEKIEMPRASQQTRGKFISRDASAVLRGVSFERLFAASLDFNRYRAMGMPHLIRSLIVEHVSPTELITFNDMKSGIFSSQHFYEVRVRSQRDGMAWTQINPGSQRYHDPQGKDLPDDSKFSRQEGSWFMALLPSGNVYVRYFIMGVVDAPLIPDRMIARHAGPMFEVGAQAVIKKLAARARVRQASP